ncbi:MAG: hypothetical protein DWQ01_08590 [Planctomycetota bacterium]|nr:MAG: hypothetical protein DWQ01_08590 [Planctomycetota bacterium]
MKSKTIKLSNGKELTFKKLNAWEIALANDAVGGSDRGQENKFKLGMALAWRSAVLGGYEKSFQVFCQEIPVDDVRFVLDEAEPFLGKSSPKKASSDSSKPSESLGYVS